MTPSVIEAFYWGILLGLIVGFGLSADQVRRWKETSVLHSVDEEQIIVELKRRRVEAELRRRTEAKVDAEIWGPPPNPKED